MSTYLDHIVSDISCRLGGRALHGSFTRPARHAENAGCEIDAESGQDLRGTSPWRSIPLWVSNDRAESYFEIYSVLPSPAAFGQAAVQWRWRLCTADGHVNASGGAYSRHDDCLAAVNALRQSAGAARIRDTEKD